MIRADIERQHRQRVVVVPESPQRDGDQAWLQEANLPEAEEKRVAKSLRLNSLSEVPGKPEGLGKHLMF